MSKPSSSLLSLLGRRRFGPLFVTQFLGAFNDNMFKNALAVLITYRLAEAQGLDSKLWIPLAAGLFILPFFLFSATAGQLADRHDKARMIRWVKLAEIPIMLLGALALVAGSAEMLVGVLFLMGSQSSFFGPLKYGILPDHLPDEDLIAANGLVETGTFLAILLGTMAGALLVVGDGGTVLMGALVVGLALAGWLSSRGIPPAPSTRPDLPVSYNLPLTTGRLLRDLSREPVVMMAVLGISWFWFLGATYLTQFPTFTKFHIGGNEQVVTLFLSLFSIGIGAGSLLCNKLLGGRVRARHLPLAALGLSLFSADLYFASPDETQYTSYMGAAAFLSEPGNWRIVADMVGLSVAGGLFIVPLYAIMQTRTDPTHRARTVAANNVLNALLMVTSAVAVLLLLDAGATVTELFALVGITNLMVVGLVWRLHRRLENEKTA
ncbi:MFS transporter [Magnetospira sp. QH-2]|uniref:MFS transporter n=1 Tax=Magnetospira sp. (strain QH-2) TaxID=1288970 RepID=UPI0003E810E7|nr:MFS transporter [Magnetospira sp. QH-2]CCQ74991.1 putative Major facilitator superfamily protein [Magnetospira sp. QH-2]